MPNRIEQRNDRIKAIYRLCWVGLVLAVISLIASIVEPVAYIVMAAIGMFDSPSYPPEIILDLIYRFVNTIYILFLLMFYVQSVSKRHRQHRQQRLTLFLLLSSVFSFLGFGLNLPLMYVSVPQVLFTICALILNIPLFIFTLLLYRKAYGKKTHTLALKPFFIVSLCASAFQIAVILYSRFITNSGSKLFPAYIFYVLVAVISIAVLVYTRIYLPYLALSDENFYQRFFFRHPFSA